MSDVEVRSVVTQQININLIPSFPGLLSNSIKIHERNEIINTLLLSRIFIPDYLCNISSILAGSHYKKPLPHSASEAKETSFEFIFSDDLLDLRALAYGIVRGATVRSTL